MEREYVPRLLKFERHDSNSALNNSNHVQQPQPQPRTTRPPLAPAERYDRYAADYDYDFPPGYVNEESTSRTHRSMSFQPSSPSRALPMVRGSNSMAPVSASPIPATRNYDPNRMYHNRDVPKAQEYRGIQRVFQVDGRRRHDSELGDEGYSKGLPNGKDEPNPFSVKGPFVGRDRMPQEFQGNSVRSQHLYEELAYDDAQRYGMPIQETDILGDEASDAQSEVYQPGTYNPADDAGSSSDEEIDDPEAIDLLEREAIIKKYQAGPDSKDIDPWENPDFELYTQMDRFGFVHKDGSKPTEAEIISRKRIIKELQREKKWLAMINAWKEGKPRKMVERIWKGIPEKLRILVWPRLLGVEELKKQAPKNAYQELLERARIVSKDIKQIDLDINRTYRDHLAFRKRYDVKQQSLLNVLAAYSMYNTEVGYCQGMSQIAALFLMYLDEEDTFWSMHALMISRIHTMHGFFVPGFPKLTRFETHFKKVLKKYRTRVYKHLEKQDIPYIYLTKWWFGCFLDRVPFSLALRLWDVFLVEGDAILIAMAMNIMKMHEKTIRKLSIENFMEFVQMTIANDFGYSDDETMHSLRDTLTKLKSDRAAVPPPPRPEDLAEVPTKALGPILKRSIPELQNEAYEIRSRCSRARSTGRSPHPRRKKTSSRSAVGSPSVNGNGGSGYNGAATPKRANGTPDRNISMSGDREVPFEIPSRRSTMNSPQAPLTPTAERRISPMSNGGTPIRVKTSSTSRPLSPGDQSPGGLGSSGWTRSSLIKDERTGQMVRVLRDDTTPTESEAPRKFAERETSAASRRFGDRDSASSPACVTHTVNNVTYIAVGEDDGSAI